MTSPVFLAHREVYHFCMKKGRRKPQASLPAIMTVIRLLRCASDRRGSCGISEYDGSCSLINTVLRPNADIYSRYYDYVFHTDLFADEFYAHGHGIVDDLWSTKWSDMKRMYISCPPSLLLTVSSALLRRLRMHLRNMSFRLIRLI